MTTRRGLPGCLAWTTKAGASSPALSGRLAATQTELWQRLWRDSQMATRAQIERLALRIEALERAEEPPRIVVVDPPDTREQALMRAGIGPKPRGQITFIHTGVPRSPEWREGRIRW